MQVVSFGMVLTQLEPWEPKFWRLLTAGLRSGDRRGSANIPFRFRNHAEHHGSVRPKFIEFAASGRTLFADWLWEGLLSAATGLGGWGLDAYLDPAFAFFVSSMDATQVCRGSTLSLMGLTPTEHASPRWTHW